MRQDKLPARHNLDFIESQYGAFSRRSAFGLTVVAGLASRRVSWERRRGGRDGTCRGLRATDPRLPFARPPRGGPRSTRPPTPRSSRARSLAPRHRQPGTVARLRAAWCGPIGVQYMHIDDVPARQWIEARMEGSAPEGDASHTPAHRPPPGGARPHAGADHGGRRLRGLHAEEVPRRKRFSLEGAETLVTVLDLVIEDAAASDADEVVNGDGASRAPQHPGQRDWKAGS